MNNLKRIDVNFTTTILEYELGKVNKAIHMWVSSQPNELFDIQMEIMSVIDYLKEDNKLRAFVQRSQ